MKIEEWNGYKIRFVEKDEEWWAVAKDVADALGYSKVDSMLRKIKSNHKDTHLVSTLGGQQELSIISEQGIYKVIFGSRKSDAEDFQDWIFNVIKKLRQSIGLEGFQVFRMIDKEHQKNAMGRLNQSLVKPVRVDFIKANTIANKTVSDMYGYPKMLKKPDMTPEMLVDRQKILDDTVELMSINDKFHLGISVSEKVREISLGNYYSA